MTYNDWVVAAAIMLFENLKEVHIDTLTQKVIHTDLSGLGKYGKTPNKTLRSNMTKKAYIDDKPIFSMYGYRTGIYSLSNPDFVKDIPSVQTIIKKLEEQKIVKLSEIEIKEFDEEHSDHMDSEGLKKERYGSYYERKSTLRAKAIQIHGLTCMACDFNFEKVFGAKGRDFIEVHHIKPICESERNVNPKTDMIVLCSNCHRMIHRNQLISLEDLKKLIDEHNL